MKLNLCKTILLTFLLVSCYDYNDKIKKEFRVCANYEINNEVYGEEIIKRDIELDFFNFLAEVESVMIESNIINSNTKESYQNLYKLSFEKIKDNNIERVANFLNDNDFSIQIYINKLLGTCLHKVALSNAVKEDSNFHNQLKLLDIIYANGYRSSKLTLDLINKIEDFEIIENRYSIILITLFNLDYQFNNSLKSNSIQ